MQLDLENMTCKEKLKVVDQIIDDIETEVSDKMTDLDQESDEFSELSEACDRLDNVRIELEHFGTHNIFD